MYHVTLQTGSLAKNWFSNQKCIIQQFNYILFIRINTFLYSENNLKAYKIWKKFKLLLECTFIFVTFNLFISFFHILTDIHDFGCNRYIPSGIEHLIAFIHPLMTTQKLHLAQKCLHVDAAKVIRAWGEGVKNLPHSRDGRKTRIVAVVG